MKKCYKFVAILMAFVIMAGSYVRPVLGYTCTCSADRPSNSDFKAAKAQGVVKSTNGNYFFSFQAKNAYDTNILYFKPDKNGYYKYFSSQVSGDSKGAIYNSNFSSIATNDDGDNGCNFVGDNGNRRNFKMVAKLSKTSNYYLVSKMFNTGTGWILGNVRPNDDAKTSDNGGIWEYVAGDTNIRTKTYLTKEETAFFYKTLCRIINNNSEKEIEQFQKELMTKYGNSGFNAAMQVAADVLDFSFSTYDGLDYANTIGEVNGAEIIEISPKVGLIILVSRFFLEGLIKAWQKSYEAKFSITSMRDAVRNAGKAGEKDDPSNRLATIYYAEHGICITAYKGIKTPDFATYDSTTLYGVDYNLGAWK